MADKNGKQALIFGAAPVGSWTFLQSYLAQWGAGMVFCADGGAAHAAAAGLKPDFLIGDWDSGGSSSREIPCVTLPAEKDFTDLQAAAARAIEMGATELLLCGCTGGRLDHTASNLMLLEWIAARGGRGLIVDEDNEARLLDEETLVLDNTPAYRYLSLVPLDRRVTGVTLRGVKYPLTDAALTRGDTFTVSNEPVGGQMQITIGTGRALLIRSERT
jgi:thiamine pyrophosphokinase